MNATNADFLHGNLTHRVLGCAYEVHSRLGPGLLESAYKACLLHELSLHRLSYMSEVLVPIRYKEAQLDAGYRADLIVESVVLIELKAVERLLSIHEAQVMTYLRLTGLQVGLLINFNVSSLKAGIRRLALSRRHAVDVPLPKDSFC
jgi:GxxExxY protein